MTNTLKIIPSDSITLAKGHKLRVDFFDMDSFSRDNFLGCIVKPLDDIPEVEVLDETLELMDDAIENNSTSPTIVSGQATFQFQVLPIQSTAIEGWFKFVALS